MATRLAWTPFEDESVSRASFFDPFEGRKPAKKGLFFEDPFANQLPKNGWCRVPRRLSFFETQQQRGRRRRRERSSNNNNKMTLKTVDQDFASVGYDSFYSTEYNDEDSMESDAPSAQITSSSEYSGERELPTIDEDTAVFVKPPSLKKVTPDDLDDFEKVAEERAMRRVQRWLHQTGLVDEFFVDPKSLPQHKYEDDSVKSIRSQEGFEIGPHGVTLEGNGEVIMKQIRNFRAVTMREMDKIDDELVELQQKANQAAFSGKNLKEYPPVVQSAVHARLNIGRIFTEVNYFTDILNSCERLQDELGQAGGDWDQIKDIVDDHVAMQSFMVDLSRTWWERPKEDARKVEAFLYDRLVAVRELGHKLRSKLLGGIGLAFGEGDTEAVRDLVEAMELYENEVEELNSLNEELDSLNEGQINRAKGIMVTGVKKIAIQRILEDCEVRGHEVFQNFQEEAADDAQSTTAEESNFQAVINACSTMTEAMEIIKDELIPVFPPTWDVFTIWSACVGSVCSQYILQLIGGQDGRNLGFLTPKQLLQLMSWIEEFRTKTGLTSSINLQMEKVQFVSTQELMRGKMIESSQESLVKVMTVLWDIHRLVEDQFLLETQKQTNQWLQSVFEADHSKTQTEEGRLITSLPEDVWILARAHLTAIRERFSAESQVFFHAATIIFRCMQSKQRDVWTAYLTDVEMCCAASNDAVRMIELAEIEMEDIKYDSDFTDEQFEQLDAVTEQLTTQFLNDAVFCAQKIHIFIFSAIEKALVGRLFEPEWEDLTHNDMAVTIVRTVEDYLDDMEKWLEESMVRKAIDALVKAAINFYIRHLLLKSIRRQKHIMEDPKRALQRISGDICIMEDFFEGYISRFPALERVLELEFEVLYAILELLEIGVGTSRARDPSDFFPFLQKKIGRLDATKFLCCQLWHLLSVQGGRMMRDLFDQSKDGLEVLDRQGTNGRLDPTLELSGVILGVMGVLRERLKVKATAKQVKSTVVKKAGKMKKRASQIIDRIAEA